MLRITVPSRAAGIFVSSNIKGDTIERNTGRSRRQRKSRDRRLPPGNGRSAFFRIPQWWRASVNSSLAKRVRFQAFARFQRGTKARHDGRQVSASVQSPNIRGLNRRFSHGVRQPVHCGGFRQQISNVVQRGKVIVAQRYQGPKTGWRSRQDSNLQPSE